MDVKALLDLLSPDDFVDFYDFDPTRDALVKDLEARGFITTNINGGAKITRLGMLYRDSLGSQPQANTPADDAPDDDTRRIADKSGRRKLVPILKWIIGIIGAIIATLVAMYIAALLGF